MSTGTEVGEALDLVANTRIKLPTVPNYLLIADNGGDGKLSIADVNEETLAIIARQWLQKWISRRSAIIENRKKYDPIT